MDYRETKEEAFEKLFRQTYQRLYYYALDWVESEETARDIVSELFSDLWAKPGGLQAADPVAYLSRAVRNRCLNHLQRRATEQRAMQAYLEQHEALMADDATAQEELMARVQAVMDTLPERTRYVVEQCYLEGRKYSELATLMNTTAGMVHKHISRALATFRKALGGSIIPEKGKPEKEHEP